MKFITVFIIGLVIYSFIKNINKIRKPEKPIPGRGAITGQDSLKLLREMMKQTKDFPDLKQVLELKQKAGGQQLLAEAAVLGVEGISGNEGTQGIEGIWGGEGTQGIEGTWGGEGTQGIEGAWGNEGTQVIEGISGSGVTQGIKGTRGQGVQASAGIPRREAVTDFLNPDFQPSKQELLQGIIWAEVLGRPRALRPFLLTRANH